MAAAAGAAFWPDVSNAQACADLAPADARIVRQYYEAWKGRDWAPFDKLLADDFTFTSANGDDHIGKAAFKKKCWDTQADFIERFDLELVLARPGEALVKYLCHTRNGKSFRNVEYHRLRGHRIAAIESYFGGKATFASAVSAKRN